LEAVQFSVIKVVVDGAFGLAVVTTVVASLQCN
jgi:hypothetical protein